MTSARLLPDVAPGTIRHPSGHPMDGASRLDAALVLDRELVALAGMDARCRLVVARLVERLIKTRSWRTLGFIRLSDYARERLGVSPRSLEDDARIVTALASLPILRGSLEAGALRWTQARLLVNVATPGNENELLEKTLLLSSRALADFVREALRTRAAPDPCSGDGGPCCEGSIRAEGRVETSIEAEEEEGPEVRWSMLVSRSGQRIWRAASEFASRCEGSRLGAARVLELVAAEALSGAPREMHHGQSKWTPDPRDLERRLLEPRIHDEARGRRNLLSFLAETGASEGFAWLEPAALLPGPAACLDGLLHDLDHADAFILDARLREARLAMQRLDSQTAALLRIGIDRRLFRELGFASLRLYVESRLGCCSRKVWSLIALERESRRSCPQLREAWREGRISHLASCALLPVLSEENGEAWIRRAGEVTLRRLLDEVAWALDSSRDDAAISRSGRPSPPAVDADLRRDGLGGLSGEEVQMRAHGDVAGGSLAPASTVRIAFSLPLSVAVLVETALYRLRNGDEARRLTFERMVALALVEWTSAPRHRDPIFERDGWRCSVPGCSSRRNLHDHHVVFRSHGGNNQRDNRIPVCAGHHLHGIHEARIRVTGLAPSGLVWELGCARGREALMTLRGDRYADRA